MAATHFPKVPAQTPVLTARQMRLADEHTISALGVPAQVLMERAAGAVVDYLLRRRDLFPVGQVLVLCGSGNNGGDGFAAARFLADGSRGERRDVRVLYTGRWNAEDGTPDETAMSAECARQYRLWRAAGVDVVPPENIAAALRESSCVVDAMLGIGLNSPVRGCPLEVIDATVHSGLPVLAVDIPTGLCADDGKIKGCALPARATVTMQALKAGHLLYPGADLCGEIAVADIGIDLTPAARPYAILADGRLLRRSLPPRARRSHKGTYGRVLAVCGSVGMSGAAVLCARGALRSGAGLVEVLTPEENRVVLQVSLPEAIVTAYGGGSVALGGANALGEAHRAALRETVRASVGRADAVVVGCGLGTGERSAYLLRTVLESLPTDRRVPLLLDADALNLLAADPTLWDTRGLSSPKRCVILTPHPAEMARLCHLSVATVLDDPMGVAERLAARHGVTVVLKDAHTAIVSPTGERYICPYGNAGMATGGSGDVLAGIMGALLAQGTADERAAASVTEMAAAGVALHAMAGDAAAAEMGEISMTPSDLMERISIVTKDFSKTVTVIENI